MVPVPAYKSAQVSWVAGIRQDLVDTEDGAEQWATILHEALRDILADPDLYRVWEY